MSTRLNLCGNGYLAGPGGAEFRLSQQTDTYASGIIPRSVASITATVKADKQADVHLALYAAPLLVDGSDSFLVAQADLTGVLNTYQDITVDVPAIEDLIDDEPTLQTGIIEVTSGSASVAGNGTAFPLDGSWDGYEIQVKGGLWNQVSSVSSVTALTLADSATASASGEFYLRKPIPRAFVVVIWCDSIVGGTVETVIRDPAITDASTQPQVPGGVTVQKMVIS